MNGYLAGLMLAQYPLNRADHPLPIQVFSASEARLFRFPFGVRRFIAAFRGRKAAKSGDESPHSKTTEYSGLRSYNWKNLRPERPVVFRAWFGRYLWAVLWLASLGTVEPNLSARW